MDAGALGACLFVGGDFNCTLAVEDVQPEAGQNPAASGRMTGSQELRLVNQGAALMDVWRWRNPSRQQPTHYSISAQLAAAGGGGGGQPAMVSQATSGGSIYYIFLSSDLVDGGWVRHSHHDVRTPSDHRQVVAKLQPPETPAVGKRRWRFPNHLLGDTEFTGPMGRSLEDAIQQQQQKQPCLDPAAEFEQLVAHIQAVARARKLRQLRDA
jgi:hypothetical protein